MVFKEVFLPHISLEAVMLRNVFKRINRLLSFNVFENQSFMNASDVDMDPNIFFIHRLLEHHILIKVAFYYI